MKLLPREYAFTFNSNGVFIKGVAKGVCGHLGKRYFYLLPPFVLAFLPAHSNGDYIFLPLSSPCMNVPSQFLLLSPPLSTFSGSLKRPSAPPSYTLISSSRDPYYSLQSSHPVVSSLPFLLTTPLPISPSPSPASLNQYYIICLNSLSLPRPFCSSRNK